MVGITPSQQPALDHPLLVLGTDFPPDINFDNFDFDFNLDEGYSDLGPGLAQAMNLTLGGFDDGALGPGPAAVPGGARPFFMQEQQQHQQQQPSSSSPPPPPSSSASAAALSALSAAGMGPAGPGWWGPPAGGIDSLVGAATAASAAAAAPSHPHPHQQHHQHQVDASSAGLVPAGGSAVQHGRAGGQFGF